MHVKPYYASVHRKALKRPFSRRIATNNRGPDTFRKVKMMYGFTKVGAIVRQNLHSQHKPLILSVPSFTISSLAAR